MRYAINSPIHPFDPVWLAPPFHVVVPRGRSVHRVGHYVHTLRDIEPIDRETIRGLPTMSPTRALLQVAALHDAARVTTALDGALRDGLTTEDAMHRRITALRAPGRNGVTRMLEVLEGCEITRGGQSWLERGLLRLIAHAGLPMPRTQAVLTHRRDKLVRVDAWFDGTPIVVEALAVHGVVPLRGR